MKKNENSVPDFLHEDGLELAREVLGSELALEVLARQDALLRVLDVVDLLALYQPLDPARLHLPLHNGQSPLQVPIQNLNPDPSPLLKLLVAQAQRLDYPSSRPVQQARRLPRDRVHL